MMQPGHFILDDQNNIVSTDLLTWGCWLQKNMERRRVGRTKISDDVRVSTVFIGLDHNFEPTGPPLLFETMVFGGEHDGMQERYCTLEEAKKGHDDVVDICTKSK